MRDGIVATIQTPPARVGFDSNRSGIGIKVAAVKERKTFLLMMARILPLKINAEIKQVKEKISLEEAVAELKECGLDPLLALYLQRYPIEPDEENTEWARMIDTRRGRDQFPFEGAKKSSESGRCGDGPPDGSLARA